MKEIILQKIGRSQLLPMKRKKKIIWKLKELFNIKNISFEIDFYGLKYQGNTENLIDKYVYYFGAYEKGMLHFIEQTLNKSESKIFVDIGANIGHHTLFASRISHQVFSFEPYEKVRKEIFNKLKINNIMNVLITPCALGEKDDELTFYEPDNHNTGTGSFIEGFLPENKNTGLKLTVKNGAKLFRDLNIKNISLIKVDTEGFEPEVLSGLLPILKEQNPVVIMEFSNDSKKLFDTKKELVNFIKSDYQTMIFENPNEYDYKFKPWNFDKTGNIVLIPKTK